MKNIISLRSGTVDIALRLFLRHTMQPESIRNIKKLSSELKQQALFFDQICIYNSDWILDQIKQGPLFQRHSSWLEELELDLEWLKSNGIVTNLSKGKKSFDFEEFNETLKLHKKFAKETNDLLIQAITQKNVGVDKLVDNMIRGDALAIRDIVMSHKKSDAFSVLASLRMKNYLYEVQNSRKVDVIEIVVKNLPVPNYDTPWERILDYRNDPDSRIKLLNLRRWISKISSTDLTNSEIEDEYEGLIYDYQTHMKLHKMKIDTTTFQTLITLPLELMEDLIKLRFSKLPEPFFALRKRKLSLLEVELNAPGRELAYVIKAKSEFSDNVE